MSDDQAYPEPWHSQNSFFKHFQGYLGIFRDIDAYSATLTGAQLKGRGDLPCLFWYLKILVKKILDCVHLWVKFPIQNIVLRESKKKTPKCFTVGLFFLVFFTEFFIKVPQFLPPFLPPPPSLHPLPWKISSCAPPLIHYSFCETLPFKRLTVFWIYSCLGNCSVICTVTLYYALHQRHPEFWHIQQCFFQLYAGVLTIIKPYSCILRLY